MVFDIPVSGEFRKLFSTLYATCKIPNPSQSPNEPPTCMDFMVWFPLTLLIDKGGLLRIFSTQKEKDLQVTTIRLEELCHEIGNPKRWLSNIFLLGPKIWKKSKKHPVNKNLYIREEGCEGRLHKFCRSHLQKWNWHQNTIKYNKES